MPKRKRVDPQEIQQSLRQIGDIVAGEGNTAIRIDLLRSLRETRDTIYQEMGVVERLSLSTLFTRPEEKVHLRDGLALLRHTLLSLDTAISVMEDNIKIEKGIDPQTDTPIENDKEEI